MKLTATPFEMSLLPMSNEILLCIAAELEFHQEISSFQRVDHHLYHLLNAHLYKFSLQKDGSSAFFHATRHKQPEVMRKLLEQISDETPMLRSRLDSALQIAAEIGQRGIISFLLDHGNASYVEHWMQSRNMRNALEIAAFFGHEQVAKLLLDRGSDVNLPSAYDRWTQKWTYERIALYAASQRGHTHVVRLLLDHGANVNSQVGLNGNAFQAAAEHGHGEVVRLLLEHGADVNVKGQEYHDRNDQFSDSNAFQIAFNKRHHAVVRLLLEHGADPCIQITHRSRGPIAASVSGYRIMVEPP